MMVNGFGRGRTVLVPFPAGWDEAGWNELEEIDRRVLDKPERKRSEPGNDGKGGYRTVVDP